MVARPSRARIGGDRLFFAWSHWSFTGPSCRAASTASVRPPTNQGCRRLLVVIPCRSSRILRQGQPGREEGVTAPIWLGARSAWCGQTIMPTGIGGRQTTRFAGNRTEGEQVVDAMRD
jgi:hypothetical protein